MRSRCPVAERDAFDPGVRHHAARVGNGQKRRSNVPRAPPPWISPSRCSTRRRHWWRSAARHGGTERFLDAGIERGFGLRKRFQFEEARAQVQAEQEAPSTAALATTPAEFMRRRHRQRALQDIHASSAAAPAQHASEPGQQLHLPPVKRSRNASIFS